MSEAVVEPVAPVAEEVAPVVEPITPQDQGIAPAEVARIVKDRLAQQAKNQFGDYEDLKAKAAGAQTLEERLGLLETELTATKQSALRTSIAARFGISIAPGAKGEPSDADLFLTGSDESTLTAQAERLVGRETDRKKLGNVAPKEGTTTTTGADDGELRDFASNLFGRK